MMTLTELRIKFGYPLLTNEEYTLVQSGEMNWSSLEAEIIRRKCLRSYPAYLQVVNFKYQMTAYHYSMAANLQHDYEKGPNPGMNYGLVLLSAPPQTGKSLSITESFQSWILIKNSRLKILTLGYGSDFAVRFGRRNKEKFIDYAPHLTRNKLKVHDRVQSAEEWEIMELNEKDHNYYPTSGGMSTAGMCGIVTGKTGNLVVIDDPIKNMQDADSEIKIANNIEFFQSAIETRLSGNPGSMCVVMCTRWVENDLIGWLRTNKKPNIVGDYNYAAMCTDGNKAKDPLRREVGEGLCPEMNKGAEWAQVIKDSYTASQGLHVYNALFQGEPSDEQGNLFKIENWKEYDVSTLDLSTCDRVYLSIDATFKDKETSDYVAMGVGAIKNGNDYKVYVVRKRMDLPDTLDKILYVLKKFPEIEIIYIEDKANGSGIISVIRKWRKRLNIPEENFPSVVGLEPIGGKYARAQAVSPYQRDGRCYLPREYDYKLFSSPDDFQWDEPDINYVWAFKQELATFPYARHDDLVDMHSQVLLKCLPLMTGEEKPTRKVVRFARYSTWWPEMEQDYKRLKTQGERDEFIRLYGANIKWKPIEEGGTCG